MRLPAAALRLALLPLLAAGCGGGGGSSGEPSIDFSRPPYVALAVGDAPVDGPADAWVTAIEFLDYSCSHCRDEAPVVAQLRELYPDDLRVAVRHFPFLAAGSEAAARAAWCAQQQGLFWEMHERLFAHFGAYSEVLLGTYAAAIPGMDLDAWSVCFASGDAAAAIDADHALGVASGVRGTPSFVLNGKLIMGAYELPEMRAFVERARAAAQASGYSRAEYYDKVVLGL